MNFFQENKIVENFSRGSFVFDLDPVVYEDTKFECDNDFECNGKAPYNKGPRGECIYDIDGTSSKCYSGSELEEIKITNNCHRKEKRLEKILEEDNCEDITPLNGKFEFNDDNLKEALQDYWNLVKDEQISHANYKYGDIKYWDTSNITEMEKLFMDTSRAYGNVFVEYPLKYFNLDISGWNTSNVYNMRSMFKDTEYFNKNLNSWDFSKLKFAENMFEGAKMFNNNNQPINWITDNLIYVENMFKDADSFTQDINNLNLDKVEDLEQLCGLDINFDITKKNDGSICFFKPPTPTPESTLQSTPASTPVSKSASPSKNNNYMEQIIIYSIGVVFIIIILILVFILKRSL